MRTPESISEMLQESFCTDKVTFQAEGKCEPWIEVSGEIIDQVGLFLRDNERLLYDYLMCLSGVHYQKEDMVGVSYHLYSHKFDHKVTIKVKTLTEHPTVQSVSEVWKTANWHEREAWDMFGIKFNNHPDLKRILCPYDWEGHPLRKDYVQPEFYGGMKVQ